MKNRMSSGHIRLFLYFLCLALLGSFLLQIPAAYKSGVAVPYIDSLFTATSAVCVTGLSTVDMNVYSRFGFCILLVLIEAGGLGIVAFISMLSGMGAKKVSMVSSRIIREYFIDDVDVNPKRILLSILRFTIGIQLLGTLILMPLFYKFGVDSFVFNSLFISVSAFCNAGFSIYSDNLVFFNNDIAINAVIMFLIIAGGIGFIVMQNIWQFFSQKKEITLHTKIVVISTISLILIQTLIILIFDDKTALANLSPAKKISAALFESVTLRTAGFETIPQANFSPISQLSSLPIMLIGGSPASMAGGIKTTTFLIVVCFFLFGDKEKNTLRIFNREIDNDTILKATGIIAKSFGMIFIALILMFIAEQPNLLANKFTTSDIFFETVSAFGTVGLSQGITSSLTTFGKTIIIFTMYIGRTGLFAMALQISGYNRADRFVRFPKESVIVG